MTTLSIMAKPAQTAQTAGQWRLTLPLLVICRRCREVPLKLECPDLHESLCRSCCLTLAGCRAIDVRSEWRTFSDDVQHSAVPSHVEDTSNPVLKGPDQLETQVATGASHGSSDPHQIKTPSEKPSKTLLAAYKKIGEMCDGLNISKNVTDTARYLFKLVEDARAFRNKPQELIIAGCIFISCRQCRVPRSFAEIFGVTKVQKNQIGRMYRTLQKFFMNFHTERHKAVVLNGGSLHPNGTYTIASATQPKDMCQRFCSHLNLPFDVSGICVALMNRVMNRGDLSGRSPLTIVTSCIYMAAHLTGHGKTIKEVSSAAHISDCTVRAAYKVILPQREHLIDPEWIKDGKGDIKNLPHH